jgi:hypothetical protein
MADQSSFTADEWKKFIEAPMLAAVAGRSTSWVRVSENSSPLSLMGASSASAMTLETGRPRLRKRSLWSLSTQSKL